MPFTSLTPSQTDKKSPIDDVMMDTIRLDLDYLNTSLTQIGSVTVDFSMSPYTVLSSDGAILADTTNGDVQIVLPDCATLGKKLFYVKLIAGTNVFQIVPTGANLIDGETALEITDVNAGTTLHSNAANYFIL